MVGSFDQREVQLVTWLLLPVAPAFNTFAWRDPPPTYCTSSYAHVQHLRWRHGSGTWLLFVCLACHRPFVQCDPFMHQHFHLYHVASLVRMLLEKNLRPNTNVVTIFWANGHLSRVKRWTNTKGHTLLGLLGMLLHGNCQGVVDLCAILRIQLASMTILAL